MHRFVAAGAFAVALGLVGIATPSVAGPVGPDNVAFNDEGAVAKSLTGKSGDAKKGRDVFKGRKLGNCLACHANSEMTDQQWHGEVGPSLDGVAERYDEAQLRGLIVNAKQTFDGTIMPSFYRLKNGVLTHKKFVGKTILTAEQVEDLIAYLKTLK